MADTERVLQILERWDELRREGKEVAPEELCQECPELLDAVKQEIRDLERLGPLFEPTRAEAATPPREAGQPEWPATVDYVPLAKDGDAVALPGWYIGKYRVVERLGRGGQAEVFRAVHPNLPGRDVVIKWANKHLSPALQQQLLEEGRALAHLEDAGVARVYDVDEHEGRPFVVMEFVRGRTLQQQLNEGRPSPRQAAVLVAQLAHTLERVHRQGICHRDLKPANILIDAAGRPRVMDFGLALMEQPWEEPRRREGDVSGTFQYMAPEQANGETGRIGPRTDVFGLGAILYALLTGRPPHQDADVMAVWEKARQGVVTPPRQLNPHIPRALERICLKALAPDPEQRYVSAGELAVALHRFGRRRWLIAAGSGAVALIALAVVVYQVVPWPASTSRTNGETAALTGNLAVRVWTPEKEKPGALPVPGNRKRGLLLTEPGALPVRNGEWLHLEAQLNRPAYVYLLWADSDGKVWPLYPWNTSKIIRKLDTPPPAQTPRQTVNSPEREKQGWHMEGKSGLETILLLARETPWPAESSLADLVGHLPAVPLRDPLELAVRGSDIGQPVGTVLEWQNRGPKPEAEQIDDPLLQLMARLRPQFPVIRAIRFAHQGD
jgi:tRNA A-37 threonylcarbamoyl transferase component Bud32